ncbi:hypothetical protein H8959_021744 [Pygathrix nigripes]
MAAVRGLRVSVKAEAPAGPDLGLPSPEAESGVDRGEPEPMEVEEGELEIVPVRRSLKELIPDTSRRYENKAGSFITGIDVTSKATFVCSYSHEKIKSLYVDNCVEPFLRKCPGLGMLFSMLLEETYKADYFFSEVSMVLTLKDENWWR